MKVCFVTTEYFLWGSYGGFGRLTRTLATHLKRRGVDVHVLIPRNQRGQPSFTHIEGVPIHSFGKTRFRTLWYTSLIPSDRKLAKEIDADVYHTEGETQFTLHVQRAVPDAKHLVTMQDPDMDYPGSLWKKWRATPYWFWELNKSELGGRVATIARKLLYNGAIRRGIQNADMVYSQARFLIPLVRQYFGLKYDPAFLPNPVEVPRHKLHKSSVPTVVYLARLDPVKRPWIFFKVARAMPDVQFVYTGKSHVPWFDAEMRRVSNKIPNLTATGHIHDKQIKGLLERSWVLVNCSIKEALPVAFLEACAYRNAVVSCLDPDGFASRFGVHVLAETNVDVYVKALRYLLKDEAQLKRCQTQGFNYVKQHHELGKVIDDHVRVYKKMLN